MTNADNFLKDNPHIKLGEFVEEEVPVLKNSFDTNTGKVTSSYQLEKVRTKYVNAPKQKVSCKTGVHSYKVLDVHKWIFGCVNCPYSKKAFPTTHKFIDGQLISKATNLPV